MYMTKDHTGFPYYDNKKFVSALGKKDTLNVLFREKALNMGFWKGVKMSLDDPPGKLKKPRLRRRVILWSFAREIERALRDPIILKKIASMCRALTNNLEDAIDLTQETYVRMMQKKHQFRAESSVEAWPIKSLRIVIWTGFVLKRATLKNIIRLNAPSNRMKT
jgi:hypothetical protein